MATTDILPYATAGGANVVSQATYAAESTLGTGMASGIVPSNYFNKILRQSTFMASGLANWMVAQGISVPDDGNMTNLVNEISAALQSFLKADVTYWCGGSGGSANAQTLTTGQSLSALTAGETFRFTSNFNNSTDTTVAIDSVGAQHLYIDGPFGPQLLQGGELLFNDDYTLLWDGSHLFLIDAARRVRLNTNLNLYVATTGSDSNSGLTSGAPFLTIQRAINVVASNYDLNGFNVTINVADGTYTGAVTVSGPWVGWGTVTLNGDTTTPANCIISTTSANCITATGAGSTINVQGFKLTTATGGHGLSAVLGGTINVTGNMNYGSIAGSLYNQINCGEGIINVNNSYTISGSDTGGAHIQITPGGIVNLAGGITVTLTGTPAFANYAAVSGPSILEIANVTFSGSATGTRYIATKNGVIDTGGGGASYLPGNAAGSTASGGQYV
jgi:hypothetical protein